MAIVEKVDNPARRGDLVVIERAERSAGLTSIRFDVMEVTSVRRDGMVKAARGLNSENDYAQPLGRIVGLQTWHLVAAALVDKAGLVAAVRAHHYPGYPGQLMSFNSIDEVKALVKPFVVKAAKR